MSLIPCSCDCTHQSEGYCTLDKAAEVTNQTGQEGCLHFVEKKTKPRGKQPRRLP